MPATLGIILNETNAIRAKPEPRIGLVLLERTFFDPPRRAAMLRWVSLVRRSFPRASLVPYAWHLLTHGVDDGARGHGTRTLPGEPHKFGGLQDSPETRSAWEVTAIAHTACESSRLAVRTPPSLTPGALGRRRLAAFAQARAAEGTSLVWEPSGLWEPIDALAFGRELGAAVLLPAFAGGRPIYDAEDSDTLVGAGAWVHVTPVGPRQAILGSQVDAVAEHVAEHADATIVVSGRRALAGARAIAEALML